MSNKLSKELGSKKIKMGALSLALVALTAGNASAAETKFFEFFKEMDSFQRLREAHEAVHNNLSVKKFLNHGKARALSLAQRVTGDELETTKFQDYFQGIEVIGSKVFHHRGRAGAEVRNTLAEFDLDVTPTLSMQEAAALAKELVGTQRDLDGKPVLKILPSGQDLSARLIYWVGIEAEADQAGRDVLIDAHTGEIIADISRHMELAPIQVFSTLDANGNMIADCQSLDEMGRPTDLNLAACNKVVVNSKISPKADSSAKSAAANTKAVLTYYQTKQGRNSYDNRGSEVVSVVHIGKKFDNAFWSSDMKMMAYGDGDGVEFGDFTKALDVAGHEMTHGVTSQTANLLYMDESGALNEAFSDFFGKMIANDGDWAIGKKIFLKGSKGIRDLANPGNLTVQIRDANGNPTTIKYPSTVKEKLAKRPTCDRTNDNCWVHINSTVPSHAAYVVHQAIGREKAEKLYYVVLTQFLNESANFATFSSATKSACKQLFDSATCDAVTKAYASVGM